MHEHPGVTALHFWRPFVWRARIGVNSASVALLVVLALGLIEPLSCIAHCLLLTAPHSHSASDELHPHAHRLRQAAPAPDAAIGNAGYLTWLDQVAHTTPAPCFLIAPLGSSPGQSHLPPAEPFHEMVPTVLAFLALPLLVQASALLARSAPPLRSVPPPLRPPIR